MVGSSSPARDSGWCGRGRREASGTQPALATAPLPDVVVARHLSSGARKELTEVGIGWVDETGAAEIATGSIIVSRSGRPPVEGREAASVDACGARGSRGSVVRSPRHRRRHTRGHGAIERKLHNALRALTELGLLEASTERGRASARKVTDRRALLIAYAAAAESLRDPLSVQVGVTWRDPVAGLGQIGRRWSMAHTDWAVTGAVAASVIAPHLGTVTTADVYLDTNTIIGLEAAGSGRWTPAHRRRPPYLSAVPHGCCTSARQTVDCLRVAPWPRVYADLLTTGVHGKGAGEHLWEVIDGR